MTIALTLPDGGRSTDEAKARAIATTLSRMLGKHAARLGPQDEPCEVGVVVVTPRGEVAIDLAAEPIKADDWFEGDVGRLPGAALRREA